MRIALTCLAVVAVLAVPARAAPAKAEPSATKTFSAWTATCDNLLDCVAIGSGDDGDALFYVRIARDAGGATSPKVKWSSPRPTRSRQSRRDPTRRRSSPSDDRSLAVEVKKDDPDGAALAGEVADPAFLFAIEKADTLDYLAGTLKGRLALKGARSRAALHRRAPGSLRHVDGVGRAGRGAARSGAAAVCATRGAGCRDRRRAGRLAYPEPRAARHGQARLRPGNRRGAQRCGGLDPGA